MARTLSIAAALLTVFVFGLTFRGTCSASGGSEIQCSGTARDIVITQTGAGGIGEGEKREWRVTMSNPCICSVQDLTVTCEGFDPTAQEIDPSVLAKRGDVCLVNDGEPIYMNDALSFTYEMDVSYPFEVSDGQIGCS